MNTEKESAVGKVYFKCNEPVYQDCGYDLTNEVPVYDILTGKECKMNFNHNLVKYDGFKEIKGNIYFLCNEDVCDSIDVMQIYARQLTRFEQYYRTRFLNMIHSSEYENAFEYLRMKNDFIFSIPCTSAEELGKSAEELCTMLAQIIYGLKPKKEEQ